ncbi:immunoglobulin-like domain-containing receptor 2 isoform X6 [Salmo trutta]|uniref:immunoglobulin-like domain-containing receptor 2 isoform X6 n=1 Tax=Salmo trutta TaxID=8032 RepID=UPI0011301097|nr:immunoglobulin-like domain-containing receptor 2 isoform X6 [Salmo trutta]
MRRKRRGEHVHSTSLNSNALIWKMCLLLRWWIPVLFLTDLPSSSAIQVSAREDRKYAMLFQSVVLPCQYSSMSTQTPVVQWWYKSYCRDRTRDAFSFPESLGVRGSELGSSSHLDCSDSSRTVRVVASVTGSSITLAEHYKGRDITIINKADLRIGELQWGDSGVYLCKVVISDDLEGRNEAPVELLVLGKTGTGLSDDLLPDFDVKIMPEWAFVGSVALGIILFILLFGVCWCQCCPHSCCCYVSCWCCPETCCCPRHLYEAGKGLRSTASSPQIAVYPPYYVPGVPAMVPIAPPSLVDTRMMSAPPSVSENSAAGVRPVYRLQSTLDQSSLDQDSLKPAVCQSSVLSMRWIQGGSVSLTDRYRRRPCQPSLTTTVTLKTSLTSIIPRPPLRPVAPHATSTAATAALRRTIIIIITAGGTLVRSTCSVRPSSWVGSQALWMSWRSLPSATDREAPGRSSLSGTSETPTRSTRDWSCVNEKVTGIGIGNTIRLLTGTRRRNVVTVTTGIAMTAQRLGENVIAKRIVMEIVRETDNAVRHPRPGRDGARGTTSWSSAPLNPPPLLPLLARAPGAGTMMTNS